jgi:hypothetical protein
MLTIVVDIDDWARLVCGLNLRAETIGPTRSDYAGTKALADRLIAIAEAKPNTDDSHNQRASDALGTKRSGSTRLGEVDSSSRVLASAEGNSDE